MLCLLGRRVDELLNNIPKTLWASFFDFVLPGKIFQKGLLEEEFLHIKPSFSDLSTFPSVSTSL